MGLQVNHEFFAALCSHNSFSKNDNKLSESCKSTIRVRMYCVHTGPYYTTVYYWEHIISLGTFKVSIVGFPNVRCLAPLKGMPMMIILGT